MALQLIIGSSGSGKSYRMYEQLIEASMAQPGENFIIIVPEQYTMQTQKNIVRMHPRHGVMNIDIVSFARLGHRIFEEMGQPFSHILEDTGKRMVIRKVLEQKRRQLGVFSGSVRKSGFSGELKSMISELLQYNISPGMLEDCLERMGGAGVLPGKLKDLSLIYAGFKEYIEGHYLTAEEILDKLCPLIASSKIIKNSRIYLDNFTGFTPSQYHLLAELLTYSKGVQMTLTVDVDEHPYELKNNYELFYLTKETLCRLEKLCRDIHCERAEDILLKTDGARTYGFMGGKRLTKDGLEGHEGRFADRMDLIHLEKNIYRKRSYAYKADPEHLKLFMAKNPGNEADFVARRIRRLVRDEGYRYREIAVISGDVAGYRHMIEKSFNAMDIPCFIDMKRSILNNAFVECLRALLEMFSENFSYPAVFRFMRSGFAHMEDEDIDLLENYVLAFGIRGNSGWKNTWMKRHSRITDNMLLALNQLRAQFYERIAPVYEVFKDKSADVRQKTAALVDWIYTMEVKAQLTQASERFEQQGQLSMAREYDQVYDVVMDLLAKLSDILGDETISIREYGDILDAGLNEAQMGLIPPGIDQVMVGDIQRTRLNGIRVLFFMGLNEGIVPSPARDGGLINDKEKEMLSRLDVELAPTARQLGYFEQYYIYAVLTAASDRVFLSYSQVSAQGKALRSSSLIRKLMKLFPALPTGECEAEEDWVSWLDNENAAFDRLIEGFQTMDKAPVPEAWKELYSWFSSSEVYGPRVKALLDAAFVSYISRPLSRAAVRAIYGNTLENSVTTLENYAACAYSHFLQYGLELAPREENEIRSPDLGIILHKALELFAAELNAGGYTWQDVPEQVRETLSRECAAKAASQFRHTMLLETKRNQYQIRRLIRYVLRTTWAIKQQLQKGDFMPDAYEIRFDSDELSGVMDVALSQNVLMKLKGTIDRIDLCQDDKNVYVKIVDYKSGNTKFDIVALYQGLSLQLVVYMNAAQALEARRYPGKRIIPAGILYYNIDDPMIETEDMAVPVNAGASTEATGELTGAAGEPAGATDASAGALGEPTGALDASARAAGEAAGTLDEPAGPDAEQAGPVDEQILARLKNGGLVNSDPDIIRMFDKEFTTESTVIPVAYTANGALSKRSGAVPTARFRELGQYVSQKVEQFGEEILAGNIAVNPYVKGSRSACTYCAFRSVCGFDERISGYKYRRLSGMSSQEAWENIHKEVDGNGEPVDG